MNNELCPYCGFNESSSAQGTGGPRPWYIFCDECHAGGPPAATEAEAWTAWNRRFVMPDRNGAPVFVDSEVWLEFNPDKPRDVRAKVSADMVHGVLFTSGEDSWSWGQVGQIELIKENKE